METSIDSFIRRTADGMANAGQYSAAKTCISALHGLLNTAGTARLQFGELTPGLLKAYEHRLLGSQKHRNTVSLYMRTLQTLCNKARETLGADIPRNLFGNVFTGSDPSLHRAIPTPILQTLRDAPLEGKDSRLTFARDMFMLSFYLRGIPFIDLAFLRKCDMQNGVISYCRSKTKRRACVQVEPCAREIIRRYAPRTSGSPYLLPIITRPGDAGQEHKQYESALRLYNKHLNRIAQKLELGIRLTSYCVRHTWATAAHDNGVDIADISAALCHSSEKMTRRYLQSFTPDRLADVNRFVIQSIGLDTGTQRQKEKKGQKERRKGKRKKNVPVLCRNRNETLLQRNAFCF